LNIRDRYKGIIEGMKSDDRKVQWNTMINWCNLWIDIENKQLKPLLELISQSHRALGISLGKDYTERYELPMVYIRYNATEDNFAIQYQKGQGGTTISVACGKEISHNQLKEIESWLHNKKGNSRPS